MPLTARLGASTLSETLLVPKRLASAVSPDTDLTLISQGRSRGRRRYRDRYERNKKRLGRQRGAKVARVDIARLLAEAIWHVLTKKEPFAPAGPAIQLVA